MPTFKIYIAKDQKRKDEKYPVSIRLTHNRKHAYLKTDYYVVKQQLNKNFEIKDKVLLKLLLGKIENCEDTVVRCIGNNVNNYTAKDIVEFIKKKQNEVKYIDFIAFARERISKLHEDGRTKRANHINTTINALVDFSGKELNISNVTSRFLSDFEAFLRSKRIIVRLNQFGKEVKTEREPLTDTGVHDYMADIRAIFNEAINRYNNDDIGDIVIKNYPFRKYKIVKPGLSAKRNIEVDSIRKIMNLDNGTIRQNLARDVFMLSFLLVGMNTVDLYNIPYYSFKNGRITYQRSKTKDRRQDNAEISIKVEPEIEGLLKKYEDPEKVHLFSFYRMYRDSSTFNAAVNKGLVKVAEKCKIENLTVYVARHSWATIARNVLNISTDDISLCLNHVNKQHKITDIYIEKDFKRIDQANRRMIDLVINAKKKE